MELPEDFQNGLSHPPMEVVDGTGYDARSTRANDTLYRTQSQGSNRSDSSGSKPPSLSRGETGDRRAFNHTTSPTDGGSRPNSRQSGEEVDNVGPIPLSNPVT